MRYKHLLLAGAVALAIPMSGCTTGAGQWAGNVLQSLTSSSTTQVSTLGDGEILVKGINQVSSQLAKSGKLDTVQLHNMETIIDAINADMDKLEAANAAGQSLTFAALNAALADWVKFKNGNGVS
jgi:hypothetical protein